MAPRGVRLIVINANSCAAVLVTGYASSKKMFLFALISWKFGSRLFSDRSCDGLSMRLLWLRAVLMPAFDPPLSPINKYSLGLLLLCFGVIS